MDYSLPATSSPINTVNRLGQPKSLPTGQARTLVGMRLTPNSRKKMLTYRQPTPNDRRN
ncbi:hypothetical protein D3C75_1264700 [compost metagenome]